MKHPKSCVCHGSGRVVIEEHDDLVRCPETVAFLARNIVNQLFDLAEVPIAKRQEINDRADAFVQNLLRP